MNLLNTRFGGVCGLRARRCATIVLALVVTTLLGSCATAPDDSRRTVNVTGDFGTPFQLQINNFG